MADNKMNHVKPITIRYESKQGWQSSYNQTTTKVKNHGKSTTIHCESTQGGQYNQTTATMKNHVKPTTTYYESKHGRQSSNNQTTEKGTSHVKPTNISSKSKHGGQSSYNQSSRTVKNHFKPTDSKQGEQSSYNKTTITLKNYDKQTSSYAHATKKEVISSGAFKGRSTVRVGYEDEHKTMSTYKFGDKRGYIEYQVEQRVRKVKYAGSSNSNKCNNCLK